MSDEIELLKSKINETLTIRDGEGREVLQLALLATVYFDRQFTREGREAIAACCEDYFQRCGHLLRWAVNPSTRETEPYGESVASNPRAWLAWLPALGEDEGFVLSCHAAQDPLGTSALSVRCVAGERLPLPHPQLAHFRVCFPLTWFSGHPGSLPEVTLEICRKLKPVSGYAGIGVLQSPFVTISQRYEPLIYQLAQRFPGLEAEFPLQHGIWLAKGREGGKPGIKGVNWLTVVADQLLAELGGADAVAADLAALDPRFIVHRWDGGVVIQAGDHPELGDVKRDAWPELYVKLARYLKPIRITRHGPCGFPGPGDRFGNGSEAAKAWLRRFDDR